MKKPEVKDQRSVVESRGSGKLTDSLEYLKKNDPTQYYYKKIKSENNPYFIDSMFVEAAKRGETDNLLALIDKAKETTYNPRYEEFLTYGGIGGYDAYILALEEPTLDNTNKSIREGFEQYGEISDKEQADILLDNYYAEYNRIQTEQQKANLKGIERFGAALGAGVGTFTAGVMNFVYDIYNLGEGIVNMIFNISGDSNIGNRFLWAFQNDKDHDIGKSIQGLEEASNDLLRRYTYLSNAITGENTFWGDSLMLMSNAIGYMLPSMLIPGAQVVAPAAATKATANTVIKTGFKSAFKRGLTKTANLLNKNKMSIIKQGSLYAGFFSGNIKDNVEILTVNGISYKDLNAGEVVTNAAIKAAAEWAIEYALGKLIGFSKLDRRLGYNGTSAVERAVAEGAQKVINPEKGLKAFGQSMGRVAKDAAKEGIEEVLQDLSSDLLDMAFGGKYYERGVTQLSIENLVQAFIVGGMTSIVVGGVANLKYINPNNRGIGVDDNGKTYRMGLFETLSFEEALHKMYGWVNTLRDSDANLDDRLDASLRLNVAFNMLGSMVRAMGLDNMLKTYNMLIEKSKSTDNEEKYQTKLEKVTLDYANHIFKNFTTKGMATLTVKRELDKAIEKAKKEAKKNKVQEALKNAGVDSVDNVVTEKIDTNNLDSGQKSELQKSLEALGIKFIVGVNGNIVLKSEDVVFVDNRIIQTDDVASLIKGITYKNVIDTIGDELSTEFKELLGKIYQEITGEEGTLEQQITALLFDENFYLKMLLVTQEQEYIKEYRNRTALQVLSTLDKSLRRVIDNDYQEGRLEAQAHKALLERVQNTMRTALIQYATLYNNLDLGTISNTIIPLDIKEEINKHPNRIFTNQINKDLADKKDNYTEENFKAFSETLDKFDLSDDLEESTKLKNLIKDLYRSGKDGRDEANLLLIFFAHEGNTNPTKLVYLPRDAQDTVSFDYIMDVETRLNSKIDVFLQGEYNIDNFSEDIKEFVAANKLNLADFRDRYSLVKELIYNGSNKTLTITPDGTVIKLLKADEFLKPEFKNTNKLKNTLIKSPLKIKDLTNIKLPSDIGEVTIQFAEAGKSGNFDEEAGIITIDKNLNARRFKSQLMHEITHAVQAHIRKIKPDMNVKGFTPKFFKENYTKETIAHILADIKQKYPLLYETVRASSKNFEDFGKFWLIYFTTEGELEANVVLNSNLTALGIIVKEDGTVISPTGQEYQMKMSIRKEKEKEAKAINESKASKQKTSTDEKAKQTIPVKEQTKAKTSTNEKAKQTIPVKEQTKAKTSTNEHKKKQLAMIRATNPAPKDSSSKVWIRSVNDIKTFDEAINDKESFTYGDFTKEEAVVALKKGKITVYSSKPITQGVFVSTSKNMALDYAGGKNKKVYSVVVPLEDVAWINGDEGQYAKVSNDKIIKAAKEIPVKVEKKTEKNSSKGSQLSMFDKLDEQEDMSLNDFEKLSIDEQLKEINNSKSLYKVSKYQLEATLPFVMSAKVRELTPKERFRHMGVKDEDFDKLKNYKYYTFSDHILNHLSGDSIVVNVLQSIFDKLYKDGFLSEDKQTKLIELFAGYGSQELALKYSKHNFVSHKKVEWALPSILGNDAMHSTKNLDVDYSKNLTKTQVVDALLKYGISLDYNVPATKIELMRRDEEVLRATYNAIKRTNNLVDVSKVTGDNLEIKEGEDVILTYSFPCQDLSKFGKRAGMSSGETRSGMVWQVLRILKELAKLNKLPKILLMENVPEILNSKNIKDFKKLQKEFKKLGYKNFVKTLSALSFNIPQTRERTFMVSILNAKQDFIFDNGSLSADLSDVSITSEDLKEKGKIDDKYYINTVNKIRTLLYKHPNFAATNLAYFNRTNARTLTTTQSFKASTAPQLYAENIKGEALVTNFLYPKNKKEVQRINKVTNELKKGKKLRISSKQLSIYEDLNGQADISLNNVNRHGDIYVSVNKARSSNKPENFEPFLKKFKTANDKQATWGVQMKPQLYNFLNNVNKNELDPYLQLLIEAGTLTMEGSISTGEEGTGTINIKHYFQTAKNINDYTFKAISKYIYLNEYMANEGKDNINKLLEKHGSRTVIEALAIVTKLADKLGLSFDLEASNSIDDLLKIYDTVVNSINSNEALLTEFNKIAKEIGLEYTTFKENEEIMHNDPLDIITTLGFMTTNLQKGSLKEIFDIVEKTAHIQKLRRKKGYRPSKKGDDTTTEKEITASYKTGVNALDYAKAKIDYDKLIRESEPDGTVDNAINLVLNRRRALLYESAKERRKGIATMREEYNKRNSERLDKYKKQLNDLELKEVMTNLTDEEIDNELYTIYVNKEIDKLYNALITVKANNEEDKALAKILYYYENKLGGTIDNRLQKIKELLEKRKMVKERNSKEGLKKAITQHRTDLKELIKTEITESNINYISPDVKEILNKYHALKYKVSDPSKKHKGKVFVNIFKESNGVIRKLGDLTKAELKELNTALITAINEIHIGLSTKEKLAKEAEKYKQSVEFEKSQKEDYKEKYEQEKQKNEEQRKEKTKWRSRIFKVVIDSDDEPNKLVKDLLNTEFEKSRMSEVQMSESNKEHYVHSLNVFFAQNLTKILTSPIEEVEQALNWFLNAKFKEGNVYEEVDFDYIRLIFFKTVIQEYSKNNYFVDINKDLLKEIDKYYTAKISMSGTLTSMQNAIIREFDPIASLKQADMTIDGVQIDKDTRYEIYDAIKSGNVNRMRAIQEKIINIVEQQRTGKRSVLRKIATLRSMSMLSSPITWLRNIFSNHAVTGLNKLAVALGKNLFKGKTQDDQLKLDIEVNDDIKEYIAKNFIDNELFSTIISNITKYNPADIDPRFKKSDGTIDKDAIMAQLVLKSLYGDYYNNHLFSDSKAGQTFTKLHKWLMERLSDNKWVQAATTKYFGKIIAEKGHNIYDEKGNISNSISDEIMNDFATALGMGLKDYMHDNNVFNAAENWLAERSEVGWFAYKMILPFASASWEWFKGAWKLTPFALIRSIHRIRHLDKAVMKAKEKYEAGKSSLSPQLTEYLIRRDLGLGVIGTIAFILGGLLAALGFIKLEEDDYGIPKLQAGPIRIDVSSVFGSSPMLAGAALVKTINDQGWENWVGALNNMGDVFLEGMPMLQIVEMDMYSHGAFSMTWDNLESMALSFIPNIIAYAAGATYSGKLDKQSNLFYKACAKIPFLANVVPKKVNPYTGDKGNYIVDALINRMVPYLSLDVASQNESKSTALGLNKAMLRGSYSINGQEIKVTGHDLMNINELYGKWNAQELDKFYNNNLQVSVKDNNTYKRLTYNQMTDEQRKNAVQNIMQNNADIAKIKVWLDKGHKYYASKEVYERLRKYGITKNVYLGSQGFVD